MSAKGHWPEAGGHRRSAVSQTEERGHMSHAKQYMTKNTARAFALSKSKETLRTKQLPFPHAAKISQQRGSRGLAITLVDISLTFGNRSYFKVTALLCKKKIL